MKHLCKLLIMNYSINSKFQINVVKLSNFLCDATLRLRSDIAF
jgi:hypothetical protein